MNLIKLTQTVQKGGCAAKVSAAELKNILEKVQFPPKDKTVLVDGSTMDDAGVVQITQDLALVQTLDFFTPIVDSPRTFGQVAAANSLSDVYAMGGEPKMAMAILAYPLSSLDPEIIVEVLQGASDKVAEAQAFFVGGHSIDDDTLKFGLSVTGYVHPQKVWTNANAEVGDDLILIKPIGTGTMMAGLKRQEWTEPDVQEAIDSMTQLNRIRDLLTVEQLDQIHACTDLTGFGLAGHGVQMAEASQVQFHIQFQQIPMFSKTMESLEKGFLTKAHRTNREYTQSRIWGLEKLSDLQKLVLFDPQTSGGLFLSVSSMSSKSILKTLQSRFPRAAIIGHVKPAGESKMVIEI